MISFFALVPRSVRTVLTLFLVGGLVVLAVRMESCRRNFVDSFTEKTERLANLDAVIPYDSPLRIVELFGPRKTTVTKADGTRERVDVPSSVREFQQEVQGTVSIDPDTTDTSQESVDLVVTKPQSRWFPDFRAPSLTVHPVGRPNAGITYTPHTSALVELNLWPEMMLALPAEYLDTGALVGGGASVLRLGPVYAGVYALASLPVAGETTHVRGMGSLSVRVHENLSFHVGMTTAQSPAFGLSYRF